MSSELMLQELSDDQLELVAGGYGWEHHYQYHERDVTTVNGNVYITYVTYNINIVYAPVYIINSKVSNSNIDNGNTYVQGNGYQGHH